MLLAHKLGAAAAALALLGAGAPAVAGSCFSPVELTGFQEVLLTLSTTGHGQFQLQNKGGALAYSLSYSGLEGTPTQAHIHFGARGLTGGISHWLCGTAAFPGPAGTPPCPTPSGTVGGNLSSAGVVGPVAQGIGLGELDELLDAICEGAAYVNVHTTLYPSGEIRGQTAD
jgi:hypothetical protein